MFLSTSTLLAAAVVLEACGGGGGDSPTSGGGGTLPPRPPTGSSSGFLLAQFPALGSVGGIANVGAVGGVPVAVVRTGQATYVALSRTCTHAQCPVDINDAGDGFICDVTRNQCGHGSRFNRTGGVTNGPATRALEQLTATLSGDGLTLTVSA